MKKIKKLKVDINNNDKYDLKWEISILLCL